MAHSGGRSARPDPAFDALVQSADYVGLPLLCKICKVYVGHKASLAHMRRLLHEANNGTSLHIAALDQARFLREAAERREAEDARREARAAELALESVMLSSSWLAVGAIIVGRERAVGSSGDDRCEMRFLCSRRSSTMIIRQNGLEFADAMSVGGHFFQDLWR